MNKKTVSRLAMFRQVQEVVIANSPIWEGVPRFVSIYDTFTEKVAHLEQSIVQQSNRTIGVSSSVKTLRGTVIEKALVISDALMVLARETDNTILRFQARTNRSELTYGTKISVMQKIRTISDLADEFVSELEPYGISIEMILELQTLSDQLNLAFTRTRSAIVSRSEITRDIDRTVSELDNLLSEGLDRLMKRFSASHPGFYGSYHNARSTITYGIRHTGGSGSTHESETL